jgi:exosortase A
MNVRALAAAGLTDVWRSGPIIAIGVGVLSLGLLFHTEIFAAVFTWDTSTAYNHCFLVLPIVAYLLWERREVFRDAVADPMPFAALAAIPLAFAWLVAERLGIMEGRQLVAMTFAELLFFVVLGPRLWWQLSGPLLYLYFLVPFGAFITPKLQDLTTIFVRHGLPLLHIPAYIDGYTIEIPEGTFLIAEACAGLRFLIAAVAFGCLYSLIMYRSALRRTVFIAVSIVVPIIANGFRALGIVALGHYLGSAEAAETDHVLYGWIFFSIVILVLIALGLPFREDQFAPSRPRAPVMPHPVMPHANHLRPALLGAVGLVLLAGIGPAIAVQFDRAAVPDMASEMPSLVPAGGCSSRPAPLTEGIDAPGRLLVQRFDCPSGVVTLAIEVFSPRSTVARVNAEQRRLTGVIGADDVESRPLPAPNTPSGAWRLVEATHPIRMAATSVWMQGKPAEGGLAARVRQAWSSIVGSRFHPVLLVVTPTGGMSGLGSPDRRQMADSIVEFVQSQPALADLVARLAGSGTLRD